jgi:Tfp pilus assembly protein PilF
VAVLRELADPSRDDELEAVFERALDASSIRGERESWLRSRESHTSGSEHVELLRRLAAIEEEDGRRDDAIQTLRRANKLATEGARGEVQSHMLALLRGHGTSREQLDLLAELIDETPESATRAAFLIERARIQADDLGAPDQAIAELEQAQREAPLGATELGLVSGLYERTGAVAQQASALGALAEATDDREEKRRALLGLAALRLDGPEAAHERDEAEAALRHVLELDPADSEGFDRLLALYSEDLRNSDVCELLQARLALQELRPSERSSLALRLATLQMESGQPAAAAQTVRDARTEGVERPALNELLFAALGAAGETPDQTELSHELALAEGGSERLRWMRRWLDSHASEDSAEARLRAVQELLVEQPGDPELIALRLPPLRQLGKLRDLAAALEDIVGGTTPLPDGRRGDCLRELLQLYEGPLERPERALELIEAEVDAEPSLRLHGAELARGLGQPSREAALLQLVLSSDSPPTPECVRRLGLTLWQSEDPAAAENLLWRALDNDPRDREILAALQSLLADRSDPNGVLQLLEARFPIEPAEVRASLAREALELAAGQDDSELELRWLRRLQALEQPSAQRCTRWLELEREAGDRPGMLFALNAVRETTDSPAERAKLLAEEAEIHAACGQLGLARDGYGEAIRLSPAPPASWLGALDAILKNRGQTAERAQILRQLCGHPELSEEGRLAHQEKLFSLLASDPELCDAAALELRNLEGLNPDADAESRIARIRQLLGVYERLDRTTDWCALAEQLVPLLPDTERRTLRQRIATRLAHPLHDVEGATAAWEAILADDPDDAEALEALASLLRHPAAEARLAEILERWADCGAPDPVACWLEAGELRWRELRDASGALRDANRALESDPSAERGHSLRSEVCRHLAHSEEEVASLEALLEADPEGPLAGDRWLRLAQVAAREPDGRERARAAAKRVLELVESLDLRTEVRRVLEQLGAWPEAVEVLRHEIESADSEQAPALLQRLARISWEELHEAEATCAALEALNQVGSLRPEEQERWAEALASLNRWPESIERRRIGLEAAGDQTPPGAWLELAREIIERVDDAQAARDACDRALSLAADHLEALSLRADICARLGDHRTELGDRARLAEVLSDDTLAARSAARAADLTLEHLGDTVGAQNLYRTALRRDGSLLTALLGAGELALQVGEWAEAERRLGTACSMLPDSDLEERLADIALGAATAAAKLQRNAEAFRFLELSLQRQPDHPGALDAMTDLSLRLGSYERARDCLETRLGSAELDEDTRADRLVQLAQAYEGTRQPEQAARRLEEVLTIRPQDEVTRARTVDLLGQLGEIERAIPHVEDWIERAPAEFAPRLELRAALLEISIDRRAEARRRLQKLVDGDEVPAAAWAELSELTLEDGSPEEVFQVTTRGLDRVETASERAALLWGQTRALEAKDRETEAAETACTALSLDPGRVECARFLAAKLPRSIDRARAVKQIERTLDTGKASTAVEAELWEAIGRAYAGPLQDIERGQLCYRRALACNPQRSSTREALADTAALDPSSHRESIHLHRQLFEEFPARPGSWHSVRLIAEHWKRERAKATSEIVLAALGLRPQEGNVRRTRPLINAGPPEQAAMRGASLLLRALSGSRSEKSSPRAVDAGLPGQLANEIAKIAGPRWNLPDEGLNELWSEPLDADQSPTQQLSRRARKHLRRALDKLEIDSLQGLETEAFRAEVLAEAGARCLERGQLGLNELLSALLSAWPETSHLDLEAAENLGAAIQICPPARSLLLRIAGATLDALGLA